MEHQDIRQLAKVMKEMELTFLELREGEFSLRMERGRSPQAAHAVFPASECVPENEGAHEKESADIHTVTAPMIGVFYASPSPEMKPFVSMGDTVRAGDVLCIIEAMKMMNEITSEVSGVVTEICVGNRQVVEYGHPLFRIRREKQQSASPAG